jgi:hypothetical protein
MSNLTFRDIQDMAARGNPTAMDLFLGDQSVSISMGPKGATRVFRGENLDGPNTGPNAEALIEELRVREIADRELLERQMWEQGIVPEMIVKVGQQVEDMLRNNATLQRVIDGVNEIGKEK